MKVEASLEANRQASPKTNDGSSYESRSMQPLVAMRAMKKLLKDPEATEQVFVIIRALSGDVIERGYRRFLLTPKAGQILRAPTSLLSVLSDRDALRQMPDGSLGRAYLGFMERGNITAEGLKDASETEEQVALTGDTGIETYALRLRDQHDLWHVVTGFGRDLAGEACLLAFTYAQTKNRGIGFIAFMAALKLRKVFGSRVISSMWQAYQMGRRTLWMPGQHWEVLLAKPLVQVRIELGVSEPDRYQSLPLELVMG
ncbi:MAG: ubiquinone biosynthesis protein COQ4 [Candidatus Azotimanducaceae bacterium]|jgi:ubiquinone biosynthesis protein COQ4